MSEYFFAKDFAVSMLKAPCRGFYLSVESVKIIAQAGLNLWSWGFRLISLSSLSVLNHSATASSCTFNILKCRPILPALNVRTLCSKAPGDGEGDHHDHADLPKDSDLVQVIFKASRRLSDCHFTDCVWSCHVRWSIATILSCSYSPA